jgi:hypothetical protein
MLAKYNVDAHAVNRYRESALTLTDDAIMLRMIKVGPALPLAPFSPSSPNFASARPAGAGHPSAQAGCVHAGSRNAA